MWWCRPQTGHGRPRRSLPLPLCDIGVPRGLGMSLDRTDLRRADVLSGDRRNPAGGRLPRSVTLFPHLVWFQYTAGHLGIVFAALFLVVGMGSSRGRGAARQGLPGITIGYRRVRRAGGLARRCELHVPAASSCGVDAPEGARSLAVVHLQCSWRGDSPDNRARCPVLAFAGDREAHIRLLASIPTVKRVPRGLHGEEPGG